MGAPDMIQAAFLAAANAENTVPTATLLIPAAAALVGVLLGGLITGASQHRQRLRDARLEAYSGLLTAYDAAVAAGEVYASFVLKELRNPQELERFMPRLTERWEIFRAAERELRERKATVELLATEEAASAVFVMSAAVTVLLVAVHPVSLDYPDLDRDRYIAQCSRWLGKSAHRRNLRRPFIDVAKIDLAAGPLSGRVRVIGRRIDLAAGPLSGHLRVIGRRISFRAGQDLRRVRKWWRGRRRPPADTGDNAAGGGEG